MKETIHPHEVIDIPEAALGRWHGAVMATKRRMRSGGTEGSVQESVELGRDGTLMLKLQLGSVVTQAPVLKGEWVIKPFETLEVPVQQRIARLIAGQMPHRKDGPYSCETALFTFISLRGYRCRTSGAFSFFYNGEGPFVDPLEDELTIALRRMMGEAVAFPRS